MNERKTAVIYFSGTGNTAILARYVAERYGIQALSAEKAQDWAPIDSPERLILLYPVYGGAPPRPVREGLKNWLTITEKCEVVVFAGQMGFSGDGAMAVAPYLPEGAEIIHAAHFNMPNNIMNFPIPCNFTSASIRRKIKRALKKCRRECDRLDRKDFRRQGDSSLWHKIGQSQREGYLEKEEEMSDKVFISEACVSCLKCVKACPVHNLTWREGDPKVKALGKCVQCYRCLNLCPCHAIALLSPRYPKRSYHCPDYESLI